MFSFLDKGTGEFTVQCCYIKKTKTTSWQLVNSSVIIVLERARPCINLARLCRMSHNLTGLRPLTSFLVTPRLSLWRFVPHRFHSFTFGANFTQCCGACTRWSGQWFPGFVIERKTSLNHDCMIPFPRLHLRTAQGYKHCFSRHLVFDCIITIIWLGTLIM